MYEDNQSAISITKNMAKASILPSSITSFVNKSVMVLLKLFIVQQKKWWLIYVYTKGLIHKQFCKLRSMAGVTQLPEQYMLKSEEEC